MQRVKFASAAGLIVAGVIASGCGRDGGSVASSSSSPSAPPAQPAPAVESPTQSPPTSTPPSTQGNSAVHPVESSGTTTSPTLPPVTAPTAPDDPKVATFAGLTAPKPATWIWHPPQRQFSVAEYAVPGRDGHDQARIDVFKAGGSVQANIDRWKTQFRQSGGGTVEPIVTPFESDGFPITLVEFAGEYKGMGMVNWSKEQLFLCAIVQTPGEMVFVRFVGPAGTVEPNRSEFMNMIQNLKRIEPEK